MISIRDSITPRREFKSAVRADAVRDDRVDVIARLSDQLCEQLSAIRFGKPVTHVYNPLDYAREMYDAYVERYLPAKMKVLFVGMNPGPWGMAQTGVPFGEIAAVRDWMKLAAPVRSPRHPHPARPILGLACPRSEASGARLWGWAKERFGTAKVFFRSMFVANYCPLCFMEASGRNRTPDRLPPKESGPLFAACDTALRGLIETCRPTFVIGIGAFAEKRIRAVASDFDLTIGRILHPSPASPAANRGWADRATAELRAIGVDIPGA